MSNVAQDLPKRIRANFPRELLEQPQWIVWRYETDAKGKPTKVPYNARGVGKASTTNPATWSVFAQAAAKYGMGGYDGIGYVFAGNGVTGMDLDHCRNARTGEVEAWAGRILTEMDSYSELSPSGTGFHLYIHAIIPGGRGRKRAMPSGGALEVYDRGRFFTVTGEVAGVVRIGGYVR